MKNESPDILDLLKDILSALMVLSVIPIPWDKVSETPPEFERSFWAFPIVGFILGFISGIIFLISYYLNLPIIISVPLAVMAGIIITGGLHEEGFAGTVQAFKSGKDRKQILELLKNSNTNIYGSLFLVILVILKISALVSLGMASHWYVFSAIIVSSTIGRSMLVFLRSISSQISKNLKDSDETQNDASVLWSSLGISFLITIIFSPFWVAIVGYTLCIIQSYLIMAYTNRKIGGVTGGVLGANEQISEILFLLVFCSLYASV